MTSFKKDAHHTENDHVSNIRLLSSSLALLQVKKHIKQGQGHEGGIFTVEAPLHASNVQIVDPVTGYGITLGF